MGARVHISLKHAKVMINFGFHRKITKKDDFGILQSCVSDSEMSGTIVFVKKCFQCSVVGKIVVFGVKIVRYTAIYVFVYLTF